MYTVFLVSLFQALLNKFNYGVFTGDQYVDPVTTDRQGKQHFRPVFCTFYETTITVGEKQANSFLY